eukprot:COSAG02_NODE_1489_length_12365_cov_22.798793_7_plen_63_part_00
MATHRDTMIVLYYDGMIGLASTLSTIMVFDSIIHMDCTGSVLLRFIVVYSLYHCSTVHACLL